MIGRRQSTLMVLLCVAWAACPRPAADLYVCPRGDAPCESASPPGPLPCGVTVDFLLLNRGEIPLRYDAQLSQQPGAGFALVAGQADTVPPGGTGVLTIQAPPCSVGRPRTDAPAGLVVLASNDPYQPRVELPLSTAGGCERGACPATAPVCVGTVDGWCGVITESQAGCCGCLGAAGNDEMLCLYSFATGEQPSPQLACRDLAGMTECLSACAEIEEVRRCSCCACVSSWRFALEAGVDLQGCAASLATRGTVLVGSGLECLAAEVCAGSCNPGTFGAAQTQACGSVSGCCECLATTSYTYGTLARPCLDVPVSSCAAALSAGHPLPVGGVGKQREASAAQCAGPFGGVGAPCAASCRGFRR
jgi:hypothetical protein